MSAPKHLWSGDWRAESAAAARERAGRHTEPQWPEEPPPPRTPPEPPEPSAFARAIAAIKRSISAAGDALRRLRPSGAPRRGAVLVVIALLLIVAGAYGLSALLGTNNSSVNAATSNSPYIGVQMESVPINRVLVSGVVPGSPADHAGIGPGDVIVAIDNHPVMQPGDVTGVVSAMHPGDAIVLQVQRGGISFAAKVTLARQPGATP